MLHLRIIHLVILDCGCVALNSVGEKRKKAKLTVPVQLFKISCPIYGTILNIVFVVAYSPHGVRYAT